MTKDDLVGIFRTSHNNCKLVYASMILFSHEDMAGFYTTWSSQLDVPQPFDQIELLSLLHDRDISKIAFSQLYDTVHRAALKELFEITKKYCQDTGQEHLLRSQPWYQFWRMIRNCFSHDFRFKFQDYDRKYLPVSWSGISLDLSIEGKPLTHGIMSREQLLDFLGEIRRFVETQLA